MSSDLPPKLKILHDVLKDGGDVHVLNIYQRVVGKETNDHRYAQQCLQRFFQRLNTRLRKEKLRVQPGVVPCTYRLVRI